jgi:hypothetical protein
VSEADADGMSEADADGMSEADAGALSGPGPAPTEPAIAAASERDPAPTEPTIAAAPTPGGSANGGEDIEAARLVALNMALDGTPRDETDRYLAANFNLADRSSLLDEVYASVQG